MLKIYCLEEGKKYRIREWRRGVRQRRSRECLYHLQQIIPGPPGITHYVFRDVKTGCITSYTNHQLLNLEIEAEE